MTLSMPKEELIKWIDMQPANQHSLTELITGLTAAQKWISPTYFYDQNGSELFERITRLPEYYLTRTETLILRKYAAEMAEVMELDRAVLVEPGCGSCEKVRWLLDQATPEAFVAMEISGSFLATSLSDLCDCYPQLPVTGLIADYHQALPSRSRLPEGKPIIFFPGSTIGNFEPGEAKRFLATLSRWLGDQCRLLIGIDLCKSVDTIIPAYNDSRGVTAQFNRNALVHINRRFGTDFDPGQFEHRAVYDNEKHRVEMHLVAQQPQMVSVGEQRVRIEADESLHTESCYKYKPESFVSLVGTAGFAFKQAWFDDDKRFGLFYFESAG